MRFYEKSTFPSVVWAEESKNSLRFEIQPSYDDVLTTYQCLTNGQSSCRGSERVRGTGILGEDHGNRFAICALIFALFFFFCSIFQLLKFLLLLLFLHQCRQGKVFLWTTLAGRPRHPMLLGLWLWTTCWNAVWSQLWTTPLHGDGSHDCWMGSIDARHGWCGYATWRGVPAAIDEAPLRAGASPIPCD